MPDFTLNPHFQYASATNDLGGGTAIRLGGVIGGAENEDGIDEMLALLDNTHRGWGHGGKRAPLLPPLAEEITGTDASDTDRLEATIHLASGRDDLTVEYDVEDAHLTVEARNVAGTLLGSFTVASSGRSRSSQTLSSLGATAVVLTVKLRRHTTSYSLYHLTAYEGTADL